MSSRSVDVAILGGGAAGLAAAREARRRGASATLINRGPLGGDCTFTGCVPSKSVIEAARDGASFAEAFDRARRVVASVAATENAAVLRAEGVEVIDDEGELVGPAELRVGERRVRAKGVVLAMGSRPAVPPVPGLADADPLTSETLWSLESAPSSLAVIGAGPMGCELAQALATLGVSVTLIELGPRVLGGEEPAASSVVHDALTKAGVDVRVGTGLTAVTPATGGARPAGVTADGAVEDAPPGGTGHRLELSDGASITAERILVAAGRRANTDRGGLADAGVALTGRGTIETGDDLSTSLKNTWAAGDVTGLLDLTHAADHMGRLAATNILRPVVKARFKGEQMPRVTFTSPEVASVGLSEAEAAGRWGAKARVAELPLTAHDRALAADATEGYLKLIAGPKWPTGTVGGGRLVGATVVAERAGEMIAELALALRLGTYIGRLALTVHPYPTWSYAIPKTAAQFFVDIEGHAARPARG
ncbi:MAG: FAD-dependent oxidoreductase [Actinomycetota bacterium]